MNWLAASWAAQMPRWSKARGKGWPGASSNNPPPACAQGCPHALPSSSRECPLRAGDQDHPPRVPGLADHPRRAPPHARVVAIPRPLQPPPATSRARPAATLSGADMRDRPRRPPSAPVRLDQLVLPRRLSFKSALRPPPPSRLDPESPSRSFCAPHVQQHPGAGLPVLIQQCLGSVLPALVVPGGVGLGHRPVMRLPLAQQLQVVRLQLLQVPSLAFRLRPE